MAAALWSNKSFIQRMKIMKTKIRSETFGIEVLLTLSLMPGFLFAPAHLIAGPSTTPVARGEPIGGPPQPNVSAATNADKSVVGSSTVSTTNSDAAATGKNDQFVVTGFDKLAAFNFDAGTDAPISADNAAETSRKIMAQIPATVKALNEKQVAVRGFMLPMKLDHGLVTEFLLLRNQMGCCYGLSPAMNELIDVRTAGKGVPALMDDLITVYGTLHIAEVRENGYLTGIYRMDCEKIGQAE